MRAMPCESAIADSTAQRRMRASEYVSELFFAHSTNESLEYEFRDLSRIAIVILGLPITTQT